MKTALLALLLTGCWHDFDRGPPTGLGAPGEVDAAMQPSSTADGAGGVGGAGGMGGPSDVGKRDASGGEMLDAAIDGTPLDGQVEDASDDLDSSDARVSDAAGLDGQVVDATASLPGSERPVSSWGQEGQNEPECTSPAECMSGEQCLTLPFSGGNYCALPCGDGLACPEGFDCCVPTAIVAQFGLQTHCIPHSHPYRASLCQP